MSQCCHRVLYSCTMFQCYMRPSVNHLPSVTFGLVTDWCKSNANFCESNMLLLLVLSRYIILTRLMVAQLSLLLQTVCVIGACASKKRYAYVAMLYMRNYYGGLRNFYSRHIVCLQRETVSLGQVKACDIFSLVLARINKTRGFGQLVLYSVSIGRHVPH